ncbi:MAG: hypothetical protein IPH18_12535 [Chitinophagaceae bacterium]|nr:hypothetical protein [Chitinophagaceae bacterium]MBK8951257.1 hypothetical protein [Chitinophagaceae bacterium]
MSISENGTAVYNAKMYNRQKGQFKTIIRKEQLDSLKTFIQQANFFSLRDDYSVRITDQPTYTLHIQQKNGQSKRIKDYGPCGPAGLKKIYEFIFSLRDTQDWK